MGQEILALDRYEAELNAAATRVAALSQLVGSLEEQVETLTNRVENETLHLKTISEADPLGGQTLEGNYYFGDLTRAPGQTLRKAVAVFGAESFIEMHSMPKSALHLVPKAYVDNIVSPLYTQLSAAVSGTKMSFLTLHKNGSDDSLAMDETNILSNSDGYDNTFELLQDHLSIRMKASGLYLITWKLSPSTVATSVVALLKLDGNEIDRMMLSPENGDTIILPMRVNKDSVIDWSILSGTCSQIYQTFSLIKLGD